MITLSLRALDLLDPRFAPDAPWTEAHSRQDELLTRSLFIQTLRNGPSRFPANLNLIHLNQQFNGEPIGTADGHRYTIEDLLVRRHTGAYGITHQFTGEIDWQLDPTEQSGQQHTREWTVQMNRHYQWITLADAYRASPSADIARCWRNELLSWCHQQTFPGRHLSFYKNGWRTIDVAIRSGWTWPYAFDVFRNAPEISDEDLWLMFTTWVQHGVYLFHYPTTRNFKTMESNGLAWTGMTFPELSLSSVFLSCALDRMMAEQIRQYTEDQIQDELAPSYGILAFSNLYSCVMAIRYALHQHPNHLGYLHIQKLEIPGQVWQRFDQQLHALERLADPSGNLPALHDSNTPSIHKLRTIYRLPEESTANPVPATPQTGWDILPYAGYAIHNQPDSQLLFDFGPWGTAHQHSDTHSLLLYEQGNPRLVDSGKPIYDTSPTSNLIRSSLGHNTVSQKSLPHQPQRLVKRAYQPVPYQCQQLGEWSLTCSGRVFHSFHPQTPTSFHSPFSWSRMIFILPQTGWLILDWVESHSGQASPWQTLWHLNPALQPEAESLSNQQVSVKFNDDYRLLFHLPRNQSIHSRLIKGQTTPTPLGWKLVENHYQPAPVLVLDHAQPADSSLLATLISSSRQALPLIPGSLEIESSRNHSRVSWQTAHDSHQIQISGNAFEQLQLTDGTHSTRINSFFMTPSQAEKLGPVLQ